MRLPNGGSKTSTSKYATLLRCVNKDGRLRGTLTYSGAMRTQRWAGNRFQAHNLPRPVVGKLRGKALKDEIAAGIRAVKAGVYEESLVPKSSGRANAPITLSAWKDDRVCLGSILRDVPSADKWKPVEKSKSWSVQLPAARD